MNAIDTLKLARGFLADASNAVDDADPPDDVDLDSLSERIDDALRYLDRILESQEAQ